MHVLNRDNFDPRFNVVLVGYEKMRDGSTRQVFRRDVHNIMTNTGRNWVVRRLGAVSYGPEVPHVTTLIKYVGFGCGGALQTNPAFPNTQTELATVVALQDPTPFATVGTLSTYLKAVNVQNATSTYFPGMGRTVFICQVPEAELSFNGAATRSGVPVGTSVPVSEAGLYLSDAGTQYDPGAPAGQDPSTANQLVAYNIFEPVNVTPNVVLRLEWELRLV